MEFDSIDSIWQQNRYHHTSNGTVLKLKGEKRFVMLTNLDFPLIEFKYKEHTYGGIALL